MKVRVAGLALLLLAMALYVAGAVRLESQAAAASDEYRQARDRRRDARSRLAQLERREAARARAIAILAAARNAPAGGVREVRRGIVDLVTRSSVAGVRLGVRPGRPPASAAVALSAEGSFADVMSLARELSRAGRGLVLGRVRLEARSSRVGLDLEASGLGSVPPGFRSRGVNPRSLFEAGGPSGSPAPPAADPDLPWPARDPFRYAEEHRQGAASAAPAIKAASSPAPAPVPSTDPLRLIGVVRKGGTVKAAVSLWGETVVMAEGEESRGYKVLSIDEEGSVRLRGPDGSELTLPPSSF